VTAPAVWVTRPEPGNRRTAGTLAAAGYTVVAVPVLEVSLCPPRDVLPRAWPDWLILVSANAVQGLAAVDRAGGLPAGDRSRVRTAAVGRRTAQAARDAGWRVDLVPEVQDSGGLLEALSGSELAGAMVWIPSGNREGSATRDLPEHLGERGAHVSVFQVYKTAARNLTADDLRALSGAEPGALVLHSPSAAEAVYGPRPETTGREPERDRLRSWRTVPAVCIGAVTAARCRALAGIQILECKSPTDNDVVDRLSSIPSLVPHGT